MTFLSESDLCGALLGAWSDQVAHDVALSVLTEVRVGTVIPDQLVLRIPKRRATASHVRRLTLFESSILAALDDDCARRPSTVASRLFTRKERVEHVLGRLARTDLVERSASGGYTLSTRRLPTHIDIIAVEAKLSRWREAVEQARQYSRFANEVYVALPVSTIESSFLPCLEHCKMFGLGLLAVTPKGTERLVKASRLDPRTPEWFWLMSRLGFHSTTTSKRETA
jgi:hypothetical protein